MIEIKDYDSTFAAKVAEMWNKSTSNWINEDIVKTEQDVINKNELIIVQFMNSIRRGRNEKID